MRDTTISATHPQETPTATRAAKLVEGQKRILALIGQGAVLDEVLDVIVKTVEDQVGPEVLASILLTEADGRLHHGSAPSLPASYTRAIDGLVIGPCAGSCGTAAYRREAVIVSDISSDPLWADFREVGLSHDLRSCWSTPILSPSGEVLGTFALYHREPKEPDEAERESVGLLSPLAALAIDRAISEKKRGVLLADAAEAESRISTIIAHAPVAIAVMRGPDHVFEAANAAYDEITGNRLLVGRSVREAFPEIGEVFYSMLDNAYRTGEPVVAQEAPVKLDRFGEGRPDRFFSFVYQPLKDSTGASYGIAVVATDITDSVEARRLAESLADQFRMLAESIPQLAWMADSDGSIFWYNRRWYEYTGTTLDQMKGWGWKSVHHPDHLDGVVERVSRAFAAGEEWEDTFPLRGRDGRYRWFLSRMHPIRDADGRVMRFFGTNTDVTDQHEAAAERERYLALERASREEAERLRKQAETARATADAANAAKTEFLTAMSHELRTPLNAIGGYTELIELGLRGPVTVEQLGDLNRIKRSQQHLLGLIGDILDLARIDAGLTAYEMRDVELTPILRDVEAMTAVQMQFHGIDYASNGCNPSLTAHADEEKVRQILLNVLANSIKFTPPGGAIYLSCTLEDGAVLIRTRDTGAGIAADKLEVIFDRFVQLERRTNQPVQGAGLGLPISRELARGMGGDLTVESRVGKGSVFTLRLQRAAG